MRGSSIAVVFMIAACGQGAIESGSQLNPRPDTGAPVWTDGLAAPSSGEICDDGLDNDGDGQVDEQCACDPVGQSSQACYPGPAATRNVGQCKDGKQQCLASGEFSAWGACAGAVAPTTEDCSDGLDNDCNGKVDDGAGCAPDTCQAETEQCGDGKDNDCDGLVDEGCTAVHAPQGCTVATMTHVTGSNDCAPHSAVYMIDDGMGPNFICCPLPATDILTTTVTVRGAACNPDEVITGAISPLMFKCTKIDLTRYRLGSAQAPCYFGSGASGGSGVAKCQSHPATFSALQQNSFGSDGCSGYPYGALFTQQIGKYCSEMLTRQLQYTGQVKGDPAAGTPVVMFKP